MKKLPRKKTNTIFTYNFFLYIKRLTGYYKKNNEKLSKKACERYQNLSEEKSKKHQYASEQYKNLSGEEKESKYQYGCE